MRQNELCQQTARRARVRGEGGKRRHELPSFQLLGHLPPSAIAEAQQYFLAFSGNDLGGDTYKISAACSLLPKTHQQYRQKLLQLCETNQDPLVEKNYTQWIHDLPAQSVLKSWFEKNFPQSYRARLSSLPSQASLDWHIDADTSVSCRISIACSPSESLFEINRRGVVESKKFQPGEVWFTNTGWLHRVINPGPEPRLNLIFGIHYNQIAHLLERV